MSATNLTRFRLVSTTGYRLPACSISCLRKLRAATMPFDHLDVDTRPVSPSRACAHCGWCGELIAVPVRCYLHDDCPPFRWALTEVGRLAVWEVLHRTSTSTLTPRGFAAFDEAAGFQRGAGAFPDLDRLVAAVLDRKVDWLA